MDAPSPPPVVLVVAGLDPSGRAGLAADVRALAALGSHAAPLASCLTEQPIGGAARVHAVDAALLRRQLEAVLAELPVGALKLGLVGSADVALALAAALAARPGLPAVIDPVLVSSTGAALVDAAARAALAGALLARAHVLTPNLDEADALLGAAPGSARRDPQAAARALLALGPRAVLLKGGHAEGERALDLWLDAEGPRELALPRLVGRAARGTGCALASALADGLARGLAPLDAAWRAKRFVHAALERTRGDGARAVLAVGPPA